MYYLTISHKRVYRKIQGNANKCPKDIYLQVKITTTKIENCVFKTLKL